MFNTPLLTPEENIIYSEFMDKRSELFDVKALLSSTSKMPCKSINISAFGCITGSKLAKKPDTICYDCYARFGMYRMPNTIKAMDEREKFINSKYFIPAMIMELATSPEFRWWDSGDVRSVQMAHDVLDVIERTPWCKHWLPTKEYAIWREVLSVRNLPDNVALRASTPMKDAAPIAGPWLTTTAFSHSDSPAKVGTECLAHLNKEKYGKYECGTCRACWDTNTHNIAYPHRKKRAK